MSESVFNPELDAHLADEEPTEPLLTPEQIKELARLARKLEDDADPELQAIIRENEHAADQREGYYRPVPTSNPTADQMIHDF